MQFKLIADENIDFKIIESLKAKDIQILSIKESYRGIADLAVIDLANDNQSLILTEDKDFGEWVFSHKIKLTGVIFLRYQKTEMQDIINTLLFVLDKYKETLYSKFTTITKGKVRIREI